MKIIQINKSKTRNEKGETLQIIRPLPHPIVQKYHKEQDEIMNCLLEKSLFLTTNSSGFRGEKKEKRLTNFSLKRLVLQFRFRKAFGHLTLPYLVTAKGWTTGLSWELAFTYSTWWLTDASLQEAQQCLQVSHDILDHRSQHPSLEVCQLSLRSYIRWKRTGMTCNSLMHMTKRGFTFFEGSFSVTLPQSGEASWQQLLETWTTQLACQPPNTGRIFL